MVNIKWEFQRLELDRPYELLTLHNKWFCVNEVQINCYSYVDGSLAYAVELVDYNEIALVNTPYSQVLNTLESYYDDGATHDSEVVRIFSSFEDALQYIDKHFPRIDFEEELKAYYPERTRTLIAENVEVNVKYGESRLVDIYQDGNGNLVLEGIGTVMFDMVDDTLYFTEV